VEKSSLAQKFIHHSKPIEIGVDFGNMCSMVSGQEIGSTIYLFQEFHTLPPHGLRELANQFLEFYSGHRKKEIIMRYDRSGNSYEQIKRDFATELASYLEFNLDGTKTGWKVTLISKGQATIYHEEEYNLAKNIMEGSNGRLPRLKICVFGCKNLRSSMEGAKTKIDTKKGTGVKTINKDKSSEKLYLKTPEKLPALSTNYSDAFKYFIFRPEWVKISRGKKFLPEVWLQKLSDNLLYLL